MNFFIGNKSNTTTNMDEMNDTDEILYYEAPPYIDVQPCEMFRSEIDKRKEFAQFVDSKVPELSNFVESLIKEYSSENAMGWVGGSRAWKRMYDKHFRNRPIDVMTESAILSAGNYDVFLVFDNKSLLTSVFSNIQNKVTKFMDKVKLSLVENYTLEIKYVKGSTMKSEEVLEMCALFPCKSIAVELTSQPTKRRNTSFSNQSTSSNTMSESSLSSNSQTQKYPEVSEKLLFYLEMSYMRDVNINMFRSEFLDDVYLNPKGVFLFSQFLKTPRMDKSINVDMLREHFLQQVIGETSSLAVLSYTTAEKYRDIFGTYYTYHKKFLNYLYMKAVYKLHQEQNKYDIQQYYTFNVMEILRPVINTCVTMLSNVLYSSQTEYSNAFVMIVGGDAMRRYNDNITMTSDIDTKMYYQQSIGQTKKKCLINLVLAFMSLFVNILNITFRVDTIDFYDIQSKTQKEYSVYLPKLKLVNEDEALERMYEKSKRVGNSFRLRFIEESCEFPVDLFSIDLNLPVDIYINDKKQHYKSNITIPVFDLVLQAMDEGASRESYIHDPKPGVLPVASLAFLKKDLNQTYSNVSKTKMRMTSEKQTKNSQRLDELEQLSPTNYSNKLDSLFHEKSVLLDNVNNLKLYIHNETDDYYKRMKNIINKNHRKSVLKHKMPFKISKMNDIEKSVVNFNWDKEVYSKTNMNTAFSSLPLRQSGGRCTRMYGHQLLNYIHKRNPKLHKLIQSNKVNIKKSLQLDKYIIEFNYLILHNKW